jgi:hypothetical protein
MIRDMPVDKIGIEEYKAFLNTCKILENHGCETPDFPDIRSRMSRLKTIEGPMSDGAFVPSPVINRRGKNGRKTHDFFSTKSMLKGSTADGESPGIRS